MYNEFFGFAESPFNITPNARFYYRTSSCEDALRMVRHAIEARKGVIAVTGEPGTGKTLFLKALARDVSARVRAVVLYNPHTDLNGLLRLLLNQLDLTPDTDDNTAMFNRLTEFLIEQRRNHRAICLLIDEAQDLDEKTLDELRLLSNLDFEDETLLPIVLLGQPELHAKLDHPSAKRIKQRIALARQTYPLVRMEVGPYIAHRLQTVKYTGPELFDAKALEKIAVYSGGIPRVVNSICDNSLLRAYAANRRVVTSDIVDQVAREMHFTASIRLRSRSTSENESRLAPDFSTASFDPIRRSATLSAIEEHGAGIDPRESSVVNADPGNHNHATAGIFDRASEANVPGGARDQWPQESSPETSAKAQELLRYEQNSAGQNQQPASPPATRRGGLNFRRAQTRLYWYGLAAVVGLLMLVFGVNVVFPQLADIYSVASAAKRALVAQKSYREPDNTEPPPNPEQSGTRMAESSHGQILTHPQLNTAALHLNTAMETDAVSGPHGINGSKAEVAAPPSQNATTKPPPPDQTDSTARADGSKSTEPRRGTVRVVSASLVRSKPADQAEIISTLEPGSRVTVLARSRDYYHVRSLDPPIRGYVHREDAFFDRKN